MVRLFRMLVLCCTTFLAGAAIADPIGVFTDIEGDVKLMRDQYYYAAEAGIEVLADDIIETGARAAAQIEMRDGTLLRLGNGGRLVLSEYRLDTQGAISAGLDLISGWLRFTVAKLRTGAEYRIDTPTMTIGIRGTEGVIQAEHTQGALYLLEGEVEVQAPDAGREAARLRTGDYVERAYGRPFHRPLAAPAGFHQRMPPAFRSRLQPRAQFLYRRGMPPRQVRRVTNEDKRRYLQQRPHLQHKLERRFQRRPRENAERAKELQHRQQERPREQPRRRDRTQERHP